MNINSYLLDSKPLIQDIIKPLLNTKNELIAKDEHPLFKEEIERQFLDAVRMKIVNFISYSHPDLSYEDIINQLDEDLVKHMVEIT